MLRVRLFGRPRLSYGEAPISAAARPKVVPLLAYLLLHRGAPSARRSIAAALWPDHADEEARANLRRHLNYLQHLLPDAPAGQPWITASASEVQWNPAAEVEVDVGRFEELVTTPQRIDQAIALYAGDLLSGVDEEWLEPHRERLRNRFIDALATQLARFRAAGDRECAMASAQRLLAVDPWREDALRTLMTLRYETGDRAGALAEYDRFARVLRDELDAEPMVETSALNDAIARDELPPALPSFGPVAARPHDALHVLPFTGRALELDMLAQCRRSAAAGRGALVLIGGESGIGKTRLAREFTVTAEAEGAQVWTATTTHPETTPYQALADLLRAAAPLLRVARVDPLWIAAVSAIVPAVAEYAGELPALPAVDPARERVRLFEAYADVWEAIAKRRPLVLIVEDLHWAGSATLAMLEHLARCAARSGMMLVGTYREDELGFAHPLRAMRRRLERDGIALHLALPRLGREAVDVLVRALGDDGASLARILYERSEGNPFFLGEILRDLHEAGRLRLEAGRWSYADIPEAAVPSAVRDAVASRLARLEGHAAALVEVAAIAGRGFDTELLRETTGWLEAAVLDALGTLIDRRIVAEHGPGSVREYGFAHSLIQAVVYDALAPAVRARRHRRIAQVMSQLYADQLDDLALAVALHWERGNEPAAAAENYVRAARRALGVFANEEADEHLRRALALDPARRVRFEALTLRERIAGGRGDRAAQATLLDELRRLAAAIDDEDAICTILDRRIELADVTGERRLEDVLLRLLERRVRRSGEARWRIRALEARARYLRGINAFEAARAAVEELIALTQQTGDRETRAAARVAYADTYIYEGRLDEARAALQDLRAAVDASDNRGALVRTLIAFSRAALVQQDYAAMSHFAEEAHQISRAIGDREGEALALHTLGNGLVYTFNVAQAEDYYRRALEIYERIGHRVGIASISVDLGLFNTELGRLDRALQLYARARDVAAEIGFRWLSCVEAVNRSYCLRLRGAFGQAKEAAEFALEVGKEVHSQPLISAALGTLGAAETELGAYAEAIAHLEEGVALRRPAGATPRLGDNLRALAFAQLRAGNLEPARRAAAELLELYEANPKLAPQPTEWLWTIAQVERRSERLAAAVDLLRHADSVMRARAAAIDDGETRAAYLALPFNRALAEERSIGA